MSPMIEDSIDRSQSNSSDRLEVCEPRVSGRVKPMATIEVTDAEDGTAIDADVGDTILLRLADNPTTGTVGGGTSYEALRFGIANVDQHYHVPLLRVLDVIKRPESDRLPRCSAAHARRHCTAVAIFGGGWSIDQLAIVMLQLFELLLDILVRDRLERSRKHYTIAYDSAHSIELRRR